MRTVKNTENIPSELKALKQWVVWLYEDVGRNKPAKMPYAVNPKKKASVSDSATWSTFDEVVEAYNKFSNINGIGFVLTGSEGIIGIDVDGKIDIDLIDRFDSYSEMTPSKNGMRIFIKADTTLQAKRFDNIELYQSARYFTVTGDLLSSCKEIKDMSIEFEDYYQSLLDLKNKSTVGDGKSAKSKSHLALTVDDQTLLQRIFKHDQYGKLQKQRYEGNIPDMDGSRPDRSKAAYYLIRCFYNWTKDRERVLRLMLNSALYDEKWDMPSNGTTFIEDDVNRVLQKCYGV